MLDDNILLFKLFYINFIIIDNFVVLVTKNIYQFYKGIYTEIIYNNIIYT